MESSVTATYRSRRLAVALWSVVVATALVLLIAVLRTGPSGWLLGLVRIGLLALLTGLVLSGKSWARWVLVAWLGLAAVLFLANLLAAASYPLALVLFLGMIGLHIWAILELVKADIAGPSVTNV